MDIQKKAMTTEFLMYSIFAFISLILIFSFLGSLLFDSRDASNSRACATFISQGLSNNAFYNKDLTDFNERFYNFMEENCYSFSNNLDARSKEGIVKEINACWNMMNSGELLLPQEMYGAGVCFYCGELKVGLEYDLSELQKELNGQEGVISIGVDKISTEDIGVFYYQYREDISGFDSIGNFLDKQINEYGGFFREYVDISDPDVGVYSGITFAEIREIKQENDVGREFYLDSIPFNERLNCKTIVPKNS